MNLLMVIWEEDGEGALRSSGWTQRAGREYTGNSKAKLPTNWTYPEIQPKLLEFARERSFL